MHGKLLSDLAEHEAGKKGTILRNWSLFDALLAVITAAGQLQNSLNEKIQTHKTRQFHSVFHTYQVLLKLHVLSCLIQKLELVGEQHFKKYSRKQLSEL